MKLNKRLISTIIVIAMVISFSAVAFAWSGRVERADGNYAGVLTVNSYWYGDYANAGTYASWTVNYIKVDMYDSNGHVQGQYLVGYNTTEAHPSGSDSVTGTVTSYHTIQDVTHGNWTDNISYTIP